MDFRHLVTWIPSHPVTGSISLQRHWGEMLNAAQNLGHGFSSLLHKPDLNPMRGSRIQRALTIHALYPFKLFKVKTPIVHILSHGAVSAGYIKSSAKKVITFHDIIPLECRENMSDNQIRRYFDRTKSQLERADAIVTVSQATLESLKNHFEFPHEKAHVVHNGFSDLAESYPCELALESVHASNSEELSMFSIGSNLKRKNLAILPDVCRHLTDKGVRISVHRVGEILPQSMRKELIQIIGSENLIEHGRVGDQELSDLYRKVDFLFFPSLNEGFGLPLLEAMGQGCPVVCSNTTSLPEVAGNAALYFDPLNPENAAEAIFKIQDPNMRENLIRDGYKQLENFSWDDCVSKYVEIYKELLA